MKRNIISYRSPLKGLTLSINKFSYLFQSLISRGMNSEVTIAPRETECQ